MQYAWGSFCSDVRPIPRRSSASLLNLLGAPDGAGHSSETGYRYGVACLLNCGNASGAFTALFYFYCHKLICRAVTLAVLKDCPGGGFFFLSGEWSLYAPENGLCKYHKKPV